METVEAILSREETRADHATQSASWVTVQRKTGHYEGSKSGVLQIDMPTSYKGV